MVALAVAALLAAWSFFSQRDDIPALQPSRKDESLSLISRDASELQRFKVILSSGDSFTILQNDGHFEVEGNPDFPLEEREISLMVKDLTLLTVNEEWGSFHLDDGDLDALGLGQTAARVTAWYTDGQKAGLIFGSSAPTEIPSGYFMLEGDGRVFTVSPEMRGHFDRPLNTLHPVPALGFSSELVDRIRFDGEDAFELCQTEGLWEVSSPFLYPADEEKIRNLLSSIEKMRLAVYAGEADTGNLERFGFIQPRRSVQITLAPSIIQGFDSESNPIDSQDIPEQVFAFEVGDAIGNIGFYLRYEGKIYQASNVSMGFLTAVGLDGILSPAPMNVPVNRLARMNVFKNGIKVEYVISLVEKILPNNDLARDESGNTLFEPYVEKDGLVTDSDAFLREYLKLMALRASGILPEDFWPESETAVVYHLDCPSVQLELALFPFDALHYAMRVNGQFIHYVDRRIAEDINL